MFPPPFPPFVFFRWILLAPFYFFFHVFPLPPSPPPLRHGSLLLLVAYVPVNVPPPAPTCPPSLIPALTLCCSQRPPVSQAAKGAPLPPPQRLHDLQTQNALPPEPEARGKCVVARQALCTCVFVSTPVSELCTCNTVWAKRYRGLKGHNVYMVSWYSRWFNNTSVSSNWMYLHVGNVTSVRKQLSWLIWTFSCSELHLKCVKFSHPAVQHASNLHSYSVEPFCFSSMLM